MHPIRWSKQRDCCSLANKISAVDAGRFESCISRKLWWLALGFKWIFDWMPTFFGNRAIQISGWKWRSRKSLSLLIHFPTWVAHSHFDYLLYLLFPHTCTCRSIDTFTMLWQNSLSVTGQMHAWKTVGSLLNWWHSLLFSILTRNLPCGFLNIFLLRYQTTCNLPIKHKLVFHK